MDSAQRSVTAAAVGDHDPVGQAALAAHALQTAANLVARVVRDDDEADLHAKSRTAGQDKAFTTRPSRRCLLLSGTREAG